MRLKEDSIVFNQLYKIFSSKNYLKVNYYKLSRKTIDWIRFQSIVFIISNKFL